MRVVIALLLQNPQFVGFVPNLDSIRQTNLPGLSLLLDVVDKCLNHPHISTGQLLEHWRNQKDERILSLLASWDIPTYKEEDNLEDIFCDSLDKVIYQCIERQIETLQAKERSIGLSVDEKRELLALMLDLKA
ncbi:DNA primase [Vibrio ishigakensis]|nr:DNA primase [Vibrio ishigakensis]GAM67707.1 DNA primase [Vibrio sp. JCM 19236]